MIIVKTQLVNNLDMVISYQIVPKVAGPKGNLPANTHTFCDKQIPSDFYNNYTNYYVDNGMLITTAENLKVD